jgi:hypothetical protein
MARAEPSLTRKLLLLTVPSVLLTALALELVFRTVIPASDEPFAYFDAADAILRYDATQHRDGVQTVGYLAQQRGHWHVNNCGWASEIDYLPRAQRRLPLVAIIGDSFVEALNVDSDKSLAARLRRRLAGRYDVYSFGMSGAALSQYLQEARYVRRRFQADVLVFVLVHNDFNEVFRPQAVHSHFLNVRAIPGGFAEEEPEPYRTSTLRHWLSRSALVRYVWMNLKIEGVRKALFRAGRGNLRPRPAPARAAPIPPVVQKATAFLIERILQENRGARIVFVTDGPRRDIYAGSVAGSEGERYNNLVRDVCATLGCEQLDMTPIFIERYRRDGRKFETPYDRHWDAYGHQVVADAVYDWIESGR